MALKLEKKVSLEERVLLDKAKELSFANNLKEASEIICNLIKLDPSCGSYYAMLGNMMWNMERLGDAEIALTKAVSFLPSSEPISRNLFHVLWEQDKNDEAFEEIKRFVKLTGSTTYDTIIKEINEKYGRHGE